VDQKCSSLYIDARLELAHRQVLAAVPDVDYQLAEQVLILATEALRRATDRPTPVSDPPSSVDARLVQQARAAINDDHPAAGGLFPLAELLGVSPYRLSRAFPRELGVSLTRYRNRVRVGRGLERLQHDAAPLAEIAAALGFADQAHFTRVVRQHLSHTPAALRRALRDVSGSAKTDTAQ
jgi:transcriptional regulator GlxA family with amidase domain